MTRYWTCRRRTRGVACGTRNPRTRRKCTACGGPRPAPRKPAHQRVLTEMNYEAWSERFGATCGICGTGPKTRRLDRDHWHTGPHAGQPRGLLCSRCNRALPNWITAAWLRKAAAYLDRATPA